MEQGLIFPLFGLSIISLFDQSLHSTYTGLIASAMALRSERERQKLEKSARKEEEKVLSFSSRFLYFFARESTGLEEREEGISSQWTQLCFESEKLCPAMQPSRYCGEDFFFHSATSEEVQGKSGQLLSYTTCSTQTMYPSYLPQLYHEGPYGTTFCT